jgi:hypothetical protein
LKIIKKYSIILSIQAWYYTEEQRWLDGIQETLLIVLSISRLFISLDYMTIEHSGIIFIMTLINSADLLFLSHSLQYHDVIIERLWMYIGLILFTINLFQMAFIDNDGLINENLLRKYIRQRRFLRNQNLRPLFRVSSLETSKSKLFFFYRIVFIHS